MDFFLSIIDVVIVSGVCDLTAYLICSSIKMFFQIILIHIIRCLPAFARYNRRSSLFTNLTLKQGILLFALAQGPHDCPFSDPSMNVY